MTPSAGDVTCTPSPGVDGQASRVAINDQEQEAPARGAGPCFRFCVLCIVWLWLGAFAAAASTTLYVPEFVAVNNGTHVEVDHKGTLAFRIALPLALLLLTCFACCCCCCCPTPASWRRWDETFGDGEPLGPEYGRSRTSIGWMVDLSERFSRQLPEKSARMVQRLSARMLSRISRISRLTRDSRFSMRSSQTRSQSPSRASRASRTRVRPTSTQSCARTSASGSASSASVATLESCRDSASGPPPPPPRFEGSMSLWRPGAHGQASPDRRIVMG